MWPMKCKHPPKKMTLVIWGHEASEQYDCECGVTLCPGQMDYVNWVIKYGRESLPK